MEYVEMPLDLIVFSRAKLRLDEADIYKHFLNRGDAYGTIVLLEPKSNTQLRYKVVSGESAVRAAYFANIDRIPCIIKETFTEGLISIATESISNIKDTSEKTIIGSSIKLEKLMISRGYSLRKAEKMGEGKKSTLNASLRLIKHLDKDVQELIESKKISKSVGIEISYEKQSFQLALAKKAIEEGWSKRDVIKARTTSPSKEKPLTKKLMREVDDYTKNLSESSGLDLLIKPISNKAGVIKITIYTNEEKRSVLMALSSVLNISFSLIAYKYKDNISENSTGYKLCTIEIKYVSLNELDNLSSLLNR